MTRRWLLAKKYLLGRVYEIEVESKLVEGEKYKWKVSCGPNHNISLGNLFCSAWHSSSLLSPQKGP